MVMFRAAMKRTCMVFAFRGCNQQNKIRNFPLRSTSNALPSPRRYLAASASSFTPPEPPSSKGVPVYSDIEFAIAQDPSSESSKRNTDPDAVFVVNGSSRGIGLQFVKSLIERTKGSVIACCRSPDVAFELNELVGNSNRIHVVGLDIEDQGSIEYASSIIKDKFSRVDLLINSAGLLGNGASTPGPERSVSQLERDWLEKTMAVNVIGPTMLSKELAPLMKSKNRRNDNVGATRPISVVANLSARVGSISDNELGGWYSYRMSKAALNQATRTMAHEFKRQGTWAVALHPGTTNTDLSKPFQRNVKEGRLFPVEFTVEQLLDVIDSMQGENSGGLYDWAGKALPF